LIRIISGTSKGRRLATLKDKTLRPTTDRVKESIFNILGEEIQESVVLDLFAGTGNLGMEALSRGAKRVLFVEKGRQAVRLIKKNTSQCSMEERSKILSMDVNRAIDALSEQAESFDLILMDPPYGKGLIEKTLLKLDSKRIYREDSILMIEHDRREPLPDSMANWRLVRQRRIGDTVISFLKPRLSAKEQEHVTEEVSYV
jgi:16S rRNA (guanine(966)-N(2))-methyltransferase RsmD